MEVSQAVGVRVRAVGFVESRAVEQFCRTWPGRVVHTDPVLAIQYVTALEAILGFPGDSNL